MMDQFESGRPIEENPTLPTPPRQPPRPTAKNVPLAIAWTVVVAAGGGFACGALFPKFGNLAALGLWPLGALAGWVARKIIVHPSRLVGQLLVIACVADGFVYVVCVLRWGRFVGVDSWAAAMKMVPVFAQEYLQSTLIIALFTVFGAMAAWQWTAVRFRWVRVVQE